MWVHDLIGASVVDTDGVVRGTCVSVIANPAHDILELDTGHLVPIIFVTSADDGVITVDPPDGLFDLLLVGTGLRFALAARSGARTCRCRCSLSLSGRRSESSASTSTARSSTLATASGFSGP